MGAGGCAQLLMQGVALSLGLPEQHFAGFCHDAMTTLRLLHYPPQSPSAAPGEKGCGAHTDWGGLTLLLQDDNSGLQVWDQESNDWIWAMPVPGSYVVNIGDLISRWTNDLYRSTLHRVVNLSGNERYSVPYFYSGNVDHKIECIHQCLDSRRVAQVPGDHCRGPLQKHVPQNLRHVMRSARPARSHWPLSSHSDNAPHEALGR
jgi:isopenicillin N synthase-like dioxygenase